MSEVQRIDRSTSKGKGQVGGRLGSQAPMWRLLVVCLVVLIGAVLVTACNETTAPDSELGNGYGPYGIAHMAASTLGNGYGPYGIVHLAASAADSAGEPGNGFGPYGVVHLLVAESGSDGEMLNGAGSYGLFRLAAGKSNAQEKVDTNWRFAGAYGALRLAASEPGPGTANYGNLPVLKATGDPAWSASAKPAGAGLDVLDENRPGISAWFDAGRYLVRSDAQRFASMYRSKAGSVSCSELRHDPRVATSSAAAAEYYEFQCSPRSAALLIGGGGPHRH